MTSPRALGKVSVLLLIGLVALPAVAQDAAELQPWSGLKGQFEIALPPGWSVFDQMTALGGKPGKTGPPIVFASRAIDGKAMMSGDQKALQKFVEQMSGVELGSIPGFILDRQPARKGMSCSGFDEKASRKILDLVGGDPMFGPGRTTREKPHAEPLNIGGCQGLRLKGKGTTMDGTGKNLDVFAPSDGEVLFLFELFNLDEHYPGNVATVEKIVSTVKLAAARVDAR